MSHLAPLSKDTTDHPGANSVTAPTDPKQQSIDVGRKLQLFSVISALRQGNYPSNAQIDEALEYFIDHPPSEAKKLSKEGRMLMQDTQNIVRTLKRIVAEKNRDELAQEFLFHTRSVDVPKLNVKSPIAGQEAKADGDQAAEHLRTLGKLIVTNSEFRKLLKDASLLGRDVAADAAAKLSDTARPNQEQLARVDEPAPANEWVGPDGTTHSQHEGVPHTGLAEKREQAKAAKEDAATEARQHAEQAKGRTESAVEGQTNGATTDAERSEQGKDAFADQAKEESKRLKEKLSSKIPEKHKDLAKEQYQAGKEYAKDKFPEERRRRFIYRLKKVVVENQRHKDYQDAVEFFLDKAETYGSTATNFASDSGSQGLSQVRNNEAYQSAQTLLRTLLERFANGASMQPIFTAVDNLYTAARNDSELRAWFTELNAYVRNVLQEPGYIMKESSDREGQRIMDSGKRFFDPAKGKYSGHKDALFDSISAFFTSYADDPLNVQLGEDVKKLTKDLLMDSDGNLKYKEHLIKDLRQVILPALIEKNGYIPIPRIEYTDDMIDVVIENLTLQSANLLPNVVEIDIRNHFKVSPYEAIKDQSKHSFTFAFSAIQADLRDVAFYVNKKKGFPKLSDSGVADVVISGKGISGVISITSSTRKDHAFKVQGVKINIDKLKFAVRGSKHSLLIATFRALATGLIKKAVAKAIEESIRAALIQIDAQLTDISERLEDAKDDESVSTLDVLKATYTEKKESAKETKEDVTPPGQFQVSATGERDSRLVNWTSPGGSIEKQAEKTAAGTRTGGWKSPAFDITHDSNTHSSSTRQAGAPSTPSKIVESAASTAPRSSFAGTAPQIPASQQTPSQLAASTTPQHGLAAAAERRA